MKNLNLHTMAEDQRMQWPGRAARAVLAWAVALVVAVGVMSAAAGAASHRLHQTAATAVGGTAASGLPVGSYSGTNPQNNWPITFYVSANQKSLQDISIPLVNLTCMPSGGGTSDHLGMASVALKSNGSFGAVTTQQGVISGVPATFTYMFQGNAEGLNAYGTPTVSGKFSETVTYKNQASNTCTSNDQSWTAARDAQPTQTASAPPVGSYSGTNPQNNWPITFYVSSDQKSLQDISIPLVNLTCMPSGGGTSDHLGMASVALKSNGSFGAVTTQQGVISGVPATFTYTFEGNFHGVNAYGVPRAAGLFAETVTFKNQASNTCTSNDQSWRVARDTQPTQTASVPPAGRYSGTNPQNNWPITFYVAANRKSLQNISIPLVNLTCMPSGGGTSDHLGMVSVALKSNGSFSGTTTQYGVFSGVPATFTYTFEGNFHGVNAYGVPRAAGMFVETVTYNTQVSSTCTSNNQSWTASLAS